MDLKNFGYSLKNIPIPGQKTLYIENPYFTQRAPFFPVTEFKGKSNPKT